MKLKSCADANEAIKLQSNVIFDGNEDFGHPISLEAFELIKVGTGDSFVNLGGNSSGSGYLRISLDPAATDAMTLRYKEVTTLPSRIMYGMSAEKKLLGQQFSLGVVAVSNGKIVERDAYPQIPILGGIVVSANVATINFAAPHGLVGGQRIIIGGCTDSRLNINPALVTIVTDTQITVPLTLASATYTVGGYVQLLPAVGRFQDAAIALYTTTSATAGSIAASSAYSGERLESITTSSQTAIVKNASPFTDALISASVNELYLDEQQFRFASRDADAFTANEGTRRINQGLPNPGLSYGIIVRAETLQSLTRPVAKITSIAKTGTTTATVTTSADHGLNATSFVQITGVRDQTNFPNLTAQTQVASIINSTQFTIIIGAAVTASSAGGVVSLVAQSTVLNNVSGGAIQSISRTNNVMTVIGSATWTGTVGAYVSILGCDAGTFGQYDTYYKILKISTTTLSLESVGPDFVSVNCGGAVIQRSDYRVHFLRQQTFTHLLMEDLSLGGSNDQTSARPITGTVAISGTVTTTFSAAQSVNNAQSIYTSAADVASAALTSTTTTAALTPGGGVAYRSLITVSAVTGTTPTMDVRVEESEDGGTNWFATYDFPRITANGAYRSPALPYSGNRIRYVQTVGGGTPSFTRAITRAEYRSEAKILRQLVDRTIVMTTLNSTTAVLRVDNPSSIAVELSLGAVTTAPSIQLETSSDGVDWIAVGAIRAGVASSVVRFSEATLDAPLFARVKVTTAGTGVTFNYCLVRAIQG